MRIVVSNPISRKAGGTEHYVEVILAELQRHGHEPAFVYERDEPADRKPVSVPPGVLSLGVAELGLETVLKRLREWKPDLIYAHGALGAEIEAGCCALAPSIYFAHNYYGTCVSGMKTWHQPDIRPCTRVLGPMCLVEYFPRRCGGLNPLTMFSLYSRETARLERLRRYTRIVVHSDHLHEEFLKHGFPEERIRNIPYATNEGRRTDTAPPVERGPEAVLLFLGRMERTKGGGVLLDALPEAHAALGRPLHVKFAGEGPDRAGWEHQAAAITARLPGVTAEFLGWRTLSQLAPDIARTDLLVVPSLWPEPFGRIGSEIGIHGVPTAAFRVGGVPSWLEDGVNGYMAPGDPPTASGLAQAIVRCLRDPAEYQRLRAGAVDVAERFTMENHMKALTSILSETAAVAFAGGRV